MVKPRSCKTVNNNNNNNNNNNYYYYCIMLVYSETSSIEASFKRLPELL